MTRQRRFYNELYSRMAKVCFFSHFYNKQTDINMNTYTQKHTKTSVYNLRQHGKAGRFRNRLYSRMGKVCLFIFFCKKCILIHKNIDMDMQKHADINVGTPMRQYNKTEWVLQQALQQN